MRCRMPGSDRQAVRVDPYKSGADANASSDCESLLLTVATGICLPQSLRASKHIRMCGHDVHPHWR